jgi:hypothetical protein
MFAAKLVLSSSCAGAWLSRRLEIAAHTMMAAKHFA